MESEATKQILASMLRKGLTAAAASLATKGWIDGATATAGVEFAVAGSMFLGSVAWSWYSARNKAAYKVEAKS